MMRGPALLGLLVLGVLVMTVGVLGLEGTGEEGLRMWVRTTARSSLLFFVLAFAARPLRQLWRHGLSAWMLRERRWLGLGYAFSHTAHAIGIGCLLGIGMQPPDAVTIAFGGAAYGLLLAMAVTSTDRWVRRLGSRRWKLLHRTGMWWNWAVFFATFAPAQVARPSWIGAAATLALLAALGLRVVAWRRTR